MDLIARSKTSDASLARTTPSIASSFFRRSEPKEKVPHSILPSSHVVSPLTLDRQIATATEIDGSDHHFLLRYISYKVSLHNLPLHEDR